MTQTYNVEVKNVEIRKLNSVILLSDGSTCTEEWALKSATSIGWGTSITVNLTDGNSLRASGIHTLEEFKKPETVLHGTGFYSNVIVGRDNQGSQLYYAGHENGTTSKYVDINGKVVAQTGMIGEAPAASDGAKQVLTGGRETWLFSTLSQSTALAMTQNFASWSLVPHGLLAEGLSLKSPEDWKRRVSELGDAGGKVGMLSSYNADEKVYIFTHNDNATTKAGATLAKVGGELKKDNAGIWGIPGLTTGISGLSVESGTDPSPPVLTGFGVFDPSLGKNGSVVFSARFIQADTPDRTNNWEITKAEVVRTDDQKDLIKITRQNIHGNILSDGNIKSLQMAASLMNLVGEKDAYVITVGTEKQSVDTMTAEKIGQALGVQVFTDISFTDFTGLTVLGIRFNPLDPTAKAATANLTHQQLSPNAEMLITTQAQVKNTETFGKEQCKTLQKSRVTLRKRIMS